MMQKFVIKYWERITGFNLHVSDVVDKLRLEEIGDELAKWLL